MRGVHYYLYCYISLYFYCHIIIIIIIIIIIMNIIIIIIIIIIAHLLSQCLLQCALYTLQIRYAVQRVSITMRSNLHISYDLMLILNRYKFKWIFLGNSLP